MLMSTRRMIARQWTRMISRCTLVALAVAAGCDASAVMAAEAAAPVTPTAPTPPSGSTSRLAGARLFVNPSTPAQRQADEWRATRPADASLMERIGQSPIATWMNGWSSDIRRDVASFVSRAAGTGALPVFVAYNIPHRDCGSYSAGGVESAAAYKQWIRDFAAGLSGRSVVVLEPDAVAGAGCLPAAARAERNELLRDAIQVLKAAQAVVYLDAGHPNWHSADVMSGKLADAGIALADGFALNVSNYVSTAANVAYGDAISARLGGKHYVIDTSRNGLGGIAGEWCNVPGQALGESPTTSTGRELVDAFLWVKYPGESDGTCNGGPASGRWWADYALGLAQRSVTIASR
jgi:endoglucanase